MQSYFLLTSNGICVRSLEVPVASDRAWVSRGPSWLQAYTLKESNTPHQSSRSRTRSRRASKSACRELAAALKSKIHFRNRAKKSSWAASRAPYAYAFDAPPPDQARLDSAPGHPALGPRVRRADTDSAKTAGGLARPPQEPLARASSDDDGGGGWWRGRALAGPSIHRLERTIGESESGCGTRETGNGTRDTGNGERLGECERRA